MAKKIVYDGELLFRTWCGWGAAASNPMLMEFCRTNYNTSSQMGPTYAMWRWAFENPEAAYPLYKEFWFDKYPDQPPLEFRDFLKLMVEKHGHNQSVVGAKSKRGLERFCAKYGLELKSSFSVGEVVQVVKHSHPLFQSLWIISGVNDGMVEAFTVNSSGICIREKFNQREIGFIGKALFPMMQGISVKNMSHLPVLEQLAEQLEIPLKRIEFDVLEGTEHGYRFRYGIIDYDDDLMWTSNFYTDLDEGIEKEIQRLKEMLRETEPVV